MEFIEKCKRFFSVDSKAYTAVMVGSIFAILVGSVLLVVTYMVLSSVFTAVTLNTGASMLGPLNTSLYANMTIITQALTIVGVSLIVAGVGGIIYTLMGVAGLAGGGRGR